MSEIPPPATAGTVHGAGSSQDRLSVIVLGVILAGFLMTILAKAFLIGVFVIPSGSMQPLLNPGDRITVNFSGHPQRGAVIIFDGTGSFTNLTAAPDGVLGSGPVQIALGVDPRTFIIKRVIGMPGDTVQCCSQTGQLIVNGSPLAEPYIFAGNAPAREPFKVTVPSGHYWVMGDHRDDSRDSRAIADQPSHGFVPASAVLGTLVGTLFSTGTTNPIAATRSGLVVVGPITPW